ncbi:MAG: NADH:ubiquinone reductase (Na(+)-transporting) subunit A [Planctomycetes bacterium]|nr:NADH:ubiquinone reductase (Na(+)-transporting) subunit A [Planctomycetota bacterium]MCB9887473.1 NADH:ubiquinone reductase (Na(+)-transporting) subunit A [Planctomycetota bacterium]
MTTHTIRKGFDLRLAGAPEPVLADAAEPATVSLHTSEFPGIKPKALVKEGDQVVTGQPLFLDKRDRDIVWCSPTTGTVQTLEFGERRFLLRAVVTNDVAKGGAERFADAIKPAGDRAGLVKAIKNAGLWQLFTQRPVGRMPMSDKEPVAIFVNGMDTAPLAADPCFATKDHKADLQAGVDLLKKLTSGKVYLCLRAAGDHQSEVRSLAGVEVHDFDGPHPSGLVGTHISRIRPLKPTEIVYALRLQDVARLGSWAKTGRYPAKTVVALAGSAAPSRRYLRVRQSAALSALLGDKPLHDVRVIDGNVLGGAALPQDGSLGLRATTLTVIPEGEGQRDLFGWALPQFGKLSFHRSVMSWLMPKKEYVVDARLNGGHRPIVNIGAWERVTPLDIHPAYLVRAIQANDIEEAMKLGLLEVTEEDVALCTFVDPCKIDVGSIVRQGLDLFEKEG